MSVKLLRKVDSSLIEITVLDATLSHSIDRTATATQHPIESGSKTTDHVQLDPVNVTVVGFVSNNPVTLLSFGLVPQQDETRSKSAYDALVQTFDNKESVQIQSEVEVFDDMVMTRLNVPRDLTNYNALQFTASFTKITKVGTLVVELAEDVEKLATPEQDLGKQTPTESSDEEDGEASLLVQALKGVGVLE
jgi:hypothetical protein